MLAISNVYNDLVSNKLSFRETDLNHEMGDPTFMIVNVEVNKHTAFIKERGNPSFDSSVIKLHRFPTGQVVNEEY